MCIIVFANVFICYCVAVKTTVDEVAEVSPKVISEDEDGVSVVSVLTYVIILS